MAKVPKHHRIKRATVLIKRTRCIKSTKNKTYPPLYQKLKINNHSLARALSQEKQENQYLFSRNVELSAEIQDLVHACNNRDLVITNILKNSKDMMQTLVTMSGFLANTISLCQEYASNQGNIHRVSTSSTRRESIRRMSTKSPARGVVKPMVSGHTITKPTINLSRVNMQRLQNANLSIIEEGPATPERSIQENRHSHTLAERGSTLRTEDDEERVVNRRTGRFSGGRLSLGRYSKRNSGRLSGGGLSSRLSKRSSEYNELIKSPRVTLQDVSRYLPNNQSVNVRTLSENSRINNRTNNTTSIEDTRMSDQSSPERSNGTIIPETQMQSSETSDSEQETMNTVRQRSQTSSSLKSSRNSEKTPTSHLTFSDSNFDPQEGTSWMFDSTDEETSPLVEPTVGNSRVTEDQHEPASSPVSSLGGEQRRNSSCFRVPALPKSFSKSKDSVSAGNSTTSLDIDTTNRFLSNGDLENDDDDDGEDDQRVNLNNFITHRRGFSSRVASLRGVESEDDDEEDETLLMNIQRQLKPQESIEQPERLQFDLNELLQLTPLKPLLNKNNGTNNGPVQVDDIAEPTATIQLTQRCPRSVEDMNTINSMTTMKLHQNNRPDLPSPITVRGHELAASGVQNKRLSELTTLRLSSRIELPRLTDVLNLSDDNQQQAQIILTPENNKQLEKRKRTVTKPMETQSANEENEEELPIQRKKKPKQRKKPSKDKDPSTAQVVLQKLDGTSRSSSQGYTARTDRKNSDESISSLRSSRHDQSSDSESSTASSSRQLSMRPRRQKAPKNLQEPSLTKKLRR